MSAAPVWDDHLAHRIAASRQEASGIAIWALGQAGFLLQHRGLSVAIDPYLSYSVDKLQEFPAGFWQRSYPPPLPAEELAGVDLVLCTHDHLDHTDPETLLALAAASPGCRFAGPQASVQEMIRAGIPAGQTVGLNEGREFSVGELKIEPVAAAHEDYETDAAGNHRWLGYLLSWAGVSLFHSGDTVVTPRLGQALSRVRIDVAFLPINGGDAARRQMGIVGNMNAAEALELARRQKIDLVVPIHHDLYPNNGATLAEFAGCWEKQPWAERPKIKAFRPGEKIVYTKAERKRPLAVIIGAGKTGRGFLARLLTDSAYEIAFIDRNAELVNRLREDGGYTIHFFGGKRRPFHIEGVTAAVAGSAEAAALLQRAAIVFTAVGESNLGEVETTLRSALAQQKKAGRRIVVCENGASPAAYLKKGLADESGEAEIGEAAIFCSTIELPGTRLDVQSEAYDELPYDEERLSGLSAFSAMKPTAHFPTLLKRKIYTYNCFSACIAYLGAFKKYQWYADAARDGEISILLDELAGPLNRAIGSAFGVEPEEQERFSQAALAKFKNEAIRDDITRNARDVARKLAPHDRVAAPARLILESGGDIRVLALTAAAALLYGRNEPGPLSELESKGARKVFCALSGFTEESACSRLVAHAYALLEENQHPLPEIFALLAREN